MSARKKSYKPPASNTPSSQRQALRKAEKEARKETQDEGGDAAATAPPTAPAGGPVTPRVEPPRAVLAPSAGEDALEEEEADQGAGAAGLATAPLDGPQWFLLPAECADLRLDLALAALFPAWSRSRIKDWIDEGRVEVNGTTVKPRLKMLGGEEVRITPVFTAVGEWLAEDIPLTVVYEDAALLVVNKPPGLTVHPGAGQYGGTLVNALLHYDPALACLPRAGLVHRLDKDTSGLLVVARTPGAHAALVAALAARQIHRQYLAVVHSVPVAGGTVAAPLGRHPRDRLRMAVVGGGRASVTHYRVRTRFRTQAALEITLETGRTHQIRVHMAHVNFPVVGDPLYGRRPRLPPHPHPDLVATLGPFPRQALHAEHLRFAHPVGGQEVACVAPPPADLAALLAALEADVQGEIERTRR